MTTFPQLISIRDPHERLLFIGDVHGQYHELKKLLRREVDARENTTVVLVGDFITKGPRNKEVVSFILENKDKVKCVFGNNEILAYLAMVNPLYPSKRQRGIKVPLQFTSEKSFIPEDWTKISKKHKDVVKEVGVKKLVELANHCSVALEFDLELTGQNMFAVHAGMLPGDFMNNNPRGHVHASVAALTDMKYVDEEDWSYTSRTGEEFKQSIRWYKLWDRYGETFENVTVVYGHDASKGLNIRKYTKGLDTSCVQGGKLSALEYKYEPDHAHYKERLIQLDC